MIHSTMKTLPYFLSLSLILMCWSGFSQNTFLQSLPSGYSQTVVTDGKLIFISGQISVNAKGETVGKGDVRAQTIQVFENIKLQLAQAGASFTDVIKLNYYVVNYKPEDGAMIREVRKKLSIGYCSSCQHVGRCQCVVQSRLSNRD